MDKECEGYGLEEHFGATHAAIQAWRNEVRALLVEVANCFETEGCEGCGTVTIETMNKVRQFLGWEPWVILRTEIPLDKH